MPEIGRLLRTLIHLAPDQVWHRIRLQRKRARVERRSERVDAAYRSRAAELPRADFAHPGLARVAHYRTAHCAEALDLVARDALAGRFRFLNRSLEFGAEVDWFRADLDVGTRLWKTLLHEFPYAPALASAHARHPDAGHRERFSELRRSWSRAAPIGCRDYARDAWNARATANRLIHFAVAAQLLELRADDPEHAELGLEIARHGLFLRDNLELDLRGNHLWRDAKGLVFANEIVGGIPDALDWLERQVREQLLPDGAHIERSPMYHAICLEDLLEVRLLLGEASPAWLDAAIRSMGGWLEAVLLGDREIPLLGDAWLGEIDTAHLLAACRELPGGLSAPEAPERHGGIVALARGPFRAVLRAGPHGPDYMLGHAHSDLLSFELSHGERRIVSEAGTKLYDPGPERSWLRSTAAHNTVQIDDAEQLEAWGSFRAGRRGRARTLATGRDAVWSWIWAASDAFEWLPGHPRHARLLAVSAEAVLVLDVVTGSGGHKISSRLHLFPGQPDTETQVVAAGATATTHESPYYERFGESRQRIRLETEATGKLPWAGGWLIRCGVEAEIEVACDLQMKDGIATLECTGGFELAATWDVGNAPTAAGVRISLCSSERESAT